MAQRPDSASSGSSDDIVSKPGKVLILTGVAAFVASVGGLALQYIGFGTSAGIVALLSTAGGLAVLTQEGRRFRDREAVRADTAPTRLRRSR